MNIEAGVKILSCPKDWKDGKNITITIPGFGSVDVELELLCDCDCSNEPQFTHNLCNNQGSLVCGVCQCEQGRLGARCECDSDTNKDLASQCVKPNTTKTDLLCSGFGACVCGKCECDELIAQGEYNNVKYLDCLHKSPLKCA